MQALKQDSWDIQYGTPGGGSYADKNSTPPKIVIGENLQSDPNTATQILAHEAGQATYAYTPDFSSRTVYVNDVLADEGAATLNNNRVQREVIANGGPNIGINGSSSNH